ncbi:MAG: NAD(P)-dependent oxidoreductase [Alphaproteobacteria bacterium]|nr:NAD(P)-dependent oxidoreductase [Alphaproteobacteria bacterium]
MDSIAFLGLGAMGVRMAGRLLDAGFPLTVWNRSPAGDDLVARGARRAGTPAEAARGAALVISMVSDDAASEAVWDTPGAGALEGLDAGALAMVSSTLTPARVRALAAKVEARGAQFLDAPVSGSLPQAEGGALIYLLGGDAAVVARARPALDVLGQAAHLCGPVGAGATVKLAVNGLLAIQIAGLGEALGALAAARLDPAASLAILSATPVMSPAMTLMGGLMVRGDHAPRFPVTLVEKDVRYAITQAASVGAALPLHEAARAVYARAEAAGHGAENLTAVRLLYR